MISLFNFKSSSWVGLDIHAEEVRLVVLKREKYSFCLKEIGVRELMPGTIVDGKVKNFKELQEVIQELVVVTEASAYPAVIALPVQSIITHRIQSIPFLTDREAEAEIASHLKSYFPGVTEELAFDFSVFNSSDSGYSDIMLVAVRVEQLREYVKVTEQAGLTVKIVDIDSLALARALKYFYPNQSTIAIFDGRQFFVFHHQELIFNQIFSVGDQEFVQHLKNAIQLCLSTHRHIQLKNLLLCGKATELARFAYQVQKECGIFIECADPFSVAAFSTRLDKNEVQRVSAKMLISCGLALHGVGV